MKTLFPLIKKVLPPAIISISLCLHGLPATGQADQFSSLLKTFEDSIPVMMERASVPGISIALVNREGVVWTFSDGATARDSGQAVSGKTLFSIQSMSKNFTAAAILIAVQEGLLDLDTPVTEYLPEFKVNSCFEPDPAEKITLRLLLSHRAGFTHEAPVGNNYTFEAGNFEDHIASISDTWLRFPVGQRYSYSNLGIDLAGYILQKASGMRFEDYVKKKLLDPVGMVRSSFDMQVILNEKDRATGNSSIYPRVPVEIAMMPAGGLYSCTDELAKYLIFQLNRGEVHGKPLIDAKWMDEMHTIQGKYEIQADGYGLGTSIIQRRGETFYAHGGGGYGFLSNMVWSEKFGAGIVILSNYVAHSLHNSLSFEILGPYIQSISGEVFEEVPLPQYGEETSFAPDTAFLRTLAGTWLYNSGGIMINEYENGKLGVRPSEQFVPFHFISENEAWVELGASRFYYRFVNQANTGQKYMIRLYDGEHLDFNGSSTAENTAFNQDDEKYTGIYVYRTYGVPSRRQMEISLINGFLYLNNMQLKKCQPALFFTPNGECLDFRHGRISWRNIPLEKL